MTRAGKTTLAGRIGLATLLVLAVGEVARAQTGGGTALVNETFSGASVPDPNFSVQGHTCLTGANANPPAGSANIPPCPTNQTGPVPPRGVVPGYLEFTDAANNEAGSILYNRPIPSSAGVVATFDQWQYGGNGADGISFFLVDGATTLTDTGGLGGSLGYAQRNSELGIKGGYLGIGFDVLRELLQRRREPRDRVRDEAALPPQSEHARHGRHHAARPGKRRDGVLLARQHHHDDHSARLEPGRIPPSGHPCARG